MNSNPIPPPMPGGPPAYFPYGSPPPPPHPPAPKSRFKSWLCYSILMSSLLANLTMYLSWKDYFSSAEGPGEKFHSGERTAKDKLAVIRISGTIMPPFTSRILKTIQAARDDDNVKGVLLAVNSPGGFVTDSHQIYHQLKKLSDKKPVYVSMGSMAASGGVYVSMGAGDGAKIFAEPTTWTGSIGVIIPHYEVTDLAEKVGFRAAPLKTGEFKDALSPFREMTDRERALWENILNQSFEQFLQVIDENRANLDLEQVRALATGQIYTAKDAQANGLIDEIGFEDEALAALQQKTGLTKARVVTYEYPITLLDALLGSVKAPDPMAQWQALFEASVPRAMYLFSAGPVPPVATP
ncbi:MAG: signal peptide peptidase SppA [Planctomycetaceae bacterium]|nr:signal peptide peptidase SppA [Planctomycetaceae bacterium]